MGADNQAERVIEGNEFVAFISHVLGTHDRCKDWSKEDRLAVAKAVVEAIRRRGRRWSI